MSVLRVVEPVELPSGDAVVARLDDLLAELAGVVSDGSPVSDVDRIDRLDRLERVRAAVAAVQAAEMVRFAQSQVAEQLAADVHPKRIGQGIADQIALACRVSPWEGSRRLGMARALWLDLPQTFAQLTQGTISERVAEHVVSETRHLDAEQRRAVDAAVNAAAIEKMGVRAAAQCARKHAYEIDPAGYVARGRTERKHRRVSLRSAPDTMSLLTGYLPVELGVACWAALGKQADMLKAAGDLRSRDQIMADLLVERVTGQASAQDVNVEIQLMMPLDSLLDPTVERAAHLLGFGPLPGPLAREAVLNSKGRRWWRRLFTHPTGGSGVAVIGGDPHRRRFSGWLAQLIQLRDQTCRDPRCEAPIRHIDHVVRMPPSVGNRAPGVWTSGVSRQRFSACERVRKTPVKRDARGGWKGPGWKVDLVSVGMIGRPHAIQITTPTGHRYTSEARGG
jgi:hypothetical protein